MEGNGLGAYPMCQGGDEMSKQAVENAFREGFRAAVQGVLTEDEAWESFVDSCSDL